MKKEAGLHERLREYFSSLLSKKQEDEMTLEKKQLLADIEQALADLRHARSCFAAASDPEIIEACVYEIKSAEARYSFLLRKAKHMASRDSKVSV